MKLLGIVFIIFSILIPTFSFSKSTILKNQNETLVEEKLQNNDYYAILEIPAIDLKQELFRVGDSKNNVDKNVFIHPSSSLPDAKKSNLILAAHSGYSDIAYFHYLDNLKIYDYVYLYYNGSKYTYQIYEKEYQNKTGTLYLKNDYSHMITLITCTKKNKNTQTIYYGMLKKVKKIEKNEVF